VEGGEVGGDKDGGMAWLVDQPAVLCSALPIDPPPPLSAFVGVVQGEVVGDGVGGRCEGDRIVNDSLEASETDGGVACGCATPARDRRGGAPPATGVSTGCENSDRAAGNFLVGGEKDGGPFDSSAPPLDPPSDCDMEREGGSATSSFCAGIDMEIDGGAGGPPNIETAGGPSLDEGGRETEGGPSRLGGGAFAMGGRETEGGPSRLGGGAFAMGGRETEGGPSCLGGALAMGGMETVGGPSRFGSSLPIGGSAVDRGPGRGRDDDDAGGWDRIDAVGAVARGPAAGCCPPRIIFGLSLLLDDFTGINLGVVGSLWRLDGGVDDDDCVEEEVVVVVVVVVEGDVVDDV